MRMDFNKLSNGARNIVYTLYTHYTAVDEYVEATMRNKNPLYSCSSIEHDGDHFNDETLPPSHIT